MADMTREEVDAKIAASTARADALMESFRETLAAVCARMDLFEHRIQQDMREFKRDVGELISDLKKTVIITCISATLATVFGVAAFNAALLSNMRSAFDSGQEAGRWRSDMQKQNEENRKMLDENRQMQMENRQMQSDNRQLLEKMERQYEQTQKMLETLKPAQGSGRR